MLISLIDGESRKRLVNARAKAMRSGCSAGTALLGDDPTRSDASRVAFMMQRCELLYLDQQFEAAVQLYDAKIEPLLDKLSLECASILADNRSTIAHASLDADKLNRFYHEVDVRRLLGVKLSDFSAALDAERAATAGKHHDALPTRWKLLLDAYRGQNWRARHWAHAGMARECLALGWPDEAVWHAVQALDKDLVQDAANHLAAFRDQKRVNLAIDRLLIFSKLARHASLTAELLYNIADCIPDSRVADVMEWVSQRLDLVPTRWTDSPVFELNWKLVGRLAHRISPALALLLAQKASMHSAVEQMSVVRRHLIEAWSRLLQGVESQQLDQFVAPALSLVTTHKFDFDYVESITLVCHLADKKPSCRDALRAALFPPGVEVSNAILLEAGPLLGWQPQDIDKLNASVVELAMALRKQVEILEAADEPAKLGGFGHVSKSQGNQKMVVHIGGAQHGLDAMAAHLKSLNDNSVRQLAQSMLDMIADDRNIVTNRISLIQSLEKFAPRLPADLAESTSKLLVRIAHGDFKESEVGQTHQEATNPLNPFKMGTGDPRDLRGVALLTLANGSKAHPTWSAQLHSGILQDFLEVDDEELRRFGVVAARNADRLSESETTALIASSLDGSPGVRKQVLHGMATTGTVAFDRRGLRLAARALRHASDATDAEERACAAQAARALLKHAEIDEEVRERLTIILNRLCSDISHFVRTCASGIGESN